MGCHGTPGGWARAGNTTVSHTKHNHLREATLSSTQISGFLKTVLPSRPGPLTEKPNGIRHAVCVSAGLGAFLREGEWGRGEGRLRGSSGGDAPPECEVEQKEWKTAGAAEKVLA